MWRFLRWVDRILNAPMMSLPWGDPDRHFERELDDRPVLDDHAFHLAYYAGTEVPEAIPVRVRRVYVAQLGRRWRSVRPDDRATDFIPGLDPYDLLQEVAAAFGLSVDPEQVAALDGSFDATVRWLAGRQTVAPRPVDAHDGGIEG